MSWPNRVCLAHKLNRVEASRRMTKNYDFVVTSGGIGPTHDGQSFPAIQTWSTETGLADITYSSLATAFSLPLTHHPETLKRMWALASPERKERLSKASAPEKEARERMALFPTAKGGHGSDGEGGARSEVIFVGEDKWVPVVRLAGKVRALFIRERELMSSSFAAMHIPWHPILVPAAPARLDALSSVTASIAEAIQTSNLHEVSSSIFHPEGTSAEPVQRARICHRSLSVRTPSQSQERGHPCWVL